MRGMKGLERKKRAGEEEKTGTRNEVQMRFPPLPPFSRMERAEDLISI